MLPIIVNIITVQFDTLFVIVYEFFNPANICTNSFKILPPSSGYIGNMLNANIRMFEYINNSNGSPNKYVSWVSL